MVTKLPDLRLDQQGVTAEFPLTRRETWHGWAIDYPGYYTGTSWSPASYDHQLGSPSLRCDVLLPEIMVGDPADIRRDISAALVAHARRHLSV